jgi:hypothetical protein
MTLVKTEADHRIYSLKNGGFKIRDTCTFNRWPPHTGIFTTLEAAEDYAWRVKNFKEGRSMRV